MTAGQSIDFTRYEIVLWVVCAFILLFVLAASRVRDGASTVGRRSDRLFRFLRHLENGRTPIVVIGFLIVACLFVVTRLRPHYFIQMRVLDDRIILGFRWPKPDVVVQLSKVIDVSMVRSPGFPGRRGTQRIQIDSDSTRYLSAKFGP